MSQLLKDQLARTKSGRNDRLNYVVSGDFDAAAFQGEEMNLVFSQAAFEHFADPEKTLRQVSSVCGPGAALVTEIDLKTHGRWIRDHDPLNIYRYSEALYNRLSFPGTPNRMRPRDYVAILKKNGWTNIEMAPLLITPENYLRAVEGRLCPRYRREDAQMEILTMMLCATRG